MLWENSPKINPDLEPRLQPFIESGFLHIDVWTRPFNQRNGAEACSKPELAGNYSWLGFPDVDEFIIMFEEYEPLLALMQLVALGNCELSAQGQIQFWHRG